MPRTIGPSQFRELKGGELVSFESLSEETLAGRIATVKWYNSATTWTSTRHIGTLVFRDPDPPHYSHFVQLDHVANLRIYSPTDSDDMNIFLDLLAASPVHRALAQAAEEPL